MGGQELITRLFENILFLFQHASFSNRVPLVCRVPLSINQPFIVLTETKFSYRYIPVWARYSPHRTRVEAHANLLSP